MNRPYLALVTPALAEANNGNSQTARRWARMLGGDYRVRLCTAWERGDEDLMVALHARRSAASIQAWHRVHPRRPLVVVLTGTDLYRDIDTDADAKRSLDLADCLVVLNQLGLQRLPLAVQAKGHICLQSAPPRRSLTKPTDALRALMVGHLRDEKSPRTYFDAARLLQGRPDILLDHIGAGLDPQLAAEARALAADTGTYHWLGEVPHGQTRRSIQAAHVLVHASRMEGGAHVVIESIMSGTPVLASRIDGNMGLLGSDYAGTFEPGDATALAALLTQCRDDPAMLTGLMAQCDARRTLFHPDTERTALLHLLQTLRTHASGAPT
ncbi:MAG: selenoneine biosynthesis selenosugar synthase SenB [Rubrivivax sp.]